MHTFDYSQIAQQSLTTEIVNLIGSIHEQKGRQAQLMGTKPAMLGKMLEVAKIQSIGSSNSIEGIITTDERLDELVKFKAEPRNRSEQEIAGYREVLATIHENNEYINVTPNIILQMHRDLYAFSGSAIGGRWKNSDNIIQEIASDGTRMTRFEPVPVWETPTAMDSLCQEFNTSISTGSIDALLLIPFFVLDFLCIHPFSDGNGRISRLLTLLFLYKSGYEVGKYISLEMLIENSKETYYEVLQQSSHGWHESQNDYLPFVQYMLGILNKAYLEFDKRVSHLSNSKLTSKDRIRIVLENQLGKLTKRQIMEICPDLGQSTVELALSELVKEDSIMKLGQGRSTAYIYNHDHFN